MLLNRRFLTCGATVLALLIGSSSAVAATHAAHTTRISGVIVSINATRHTLKLRVTHGTKHRKAGPARTASAGDSRGILVSFGDATVHGPNGAVAVGDDVTVTTTGPVGQSAVASSIDVIGQPNGGDRRQGRGGPRGGHRRRPDQRDADPDRQGNRLAGAVAGQFGDRQRQREHDPGRR